MMSIGLSGFSTADAGRDGFAASPEALRIIFDFRPPVAALIVSVVINVALARRSGAASATRAAI
ncbi:hypothetical protein [Bradyrhizobium sp. HKCCYLS20291]|uniref:hypothetical protein n=1 Tax=Bradyrhizobium sp. HKCCYLS20291 TaxID=3420766 RepID=UPI003EBB28B4